MADFLYQIDLSIFYFFNHTLSCSALDRFFTTITNVNNWFITYIIFAGILLLKDGKRGKLVFIVCILMVIVTDQTGYRLLKEWFARPRPFRVLNDVFLPAGESGTWSFPSNHALNNFAGAVFFSSIYYQYKIPFYIAAALMAVSRVYIGVHYPSDVIGGALLGIGFGYLFALLYKELVKIPFFNDFPPASEQTKKQS